MDSANGPDRQPKEAAARPPRIPERIGTPGLTGVVEEGGKLVRAGSSAEAGAVETTERRGPVGAAAPSAGASSGATKLEDGARPTTEGSAAEPAAPAAGEQTLRLYAEELQVKTERVQTGEARVHTRTVTELQTIQVPVQREELVIERAGTVTIVAADGTATTTAATDQPTWRQHLRRRRAVLFGLSGGVLLAVLALVLWRTGRIGAARSA